MLKQSFFAATAAAVVALGTVTPVFAADGAQDFVLINNSGITIDEVYVEASSVEDSWGDDILGQETLPDGEEVEINFTGYEDECTFDIKIVDDEGEEYTLAGLDLCKIHKFEVGSNDDGGLTWKAE